MEPFRQGQKGSSAMPHKRNPILSERIAGLARLLRGYAQTGFENQPLWHERDISHSSAERVILPDATILLDYMLARTTGLVEGLVVRPERMRENIERGLGLHASSRVLLALVERGRALARGRVRDRPAQRPPRRRRAGAAAGACSRPTRPSRRSCRSPTSTPASTTTAVLRHVPEVIARLDALEARCARGGPSRETEGRCCALSAVRAVGQGARPVPARRRAPAARRVGPAVGLRRRPADADPRQGPRPDRPVALLVRARRPAIVPNHLLGDRPRRRCRPTLGADPDVADELRGRMMIGPAGRGAARRVRGPRLPVRLGLEGVPDDRRGVRHPAPAGPPRERPAAGADLHARLEGAGRRARREHPVREGRDADRPRAGGRGPRGVARPVRATAPRSASGRGSSSRTRSSSSGSCRRASCILIDEVMTPDSVALLGRRGRTSPGRAQASYDKQFVRDWLERSRGTKTAPGPELPGRRRRRAPAPATSRPSSASPGRASPATSRRTSSPDERAHPRLPLRRQRHAQARHPRPPGQGRRAQPAAPRDRRGRAASASAAGSS